MKVLSIRQPWADLIVLGIKKAEFRSWKSPYRGAVVIHASKQVEKDARLHFLRLLDRPWEWYVEKDVKEKLRGYLTYPRTGVALGIGKLVEIAKSEYFYQELGFSEESFAWIFEDVRPLKIEVPLKGKLGLFSVRGEDEKRVQLAMLNEPRRLRLDVQSQESDQGKYVVVNGKRYIKKGLFKIPVEE